MTTINQLISRSGNVREVLGVAEDDRTLDLSNLDWEEQYEVVRGITFDRIRIADTRISTDFVECVFENSEFVKLYSKSHFSAAGNTWQRCVFESLTLVDLIAPQSRFLDCQFRDVSIHGMRLCQTLFDNCRFVNCEFEGLLSRRVGDRSLQLPEVVRAGASALFQSCQFETGSFTGCYFSDIGFEKCEVSGTRFINCEFRDVVGPDRWWKEFESGDPFIAFLNMVLRGIEEQVGRESRAFVALAEYAEDYRLQRTKSKDYSACLYAGDVPDDELDAIQDLLDEAETAFPM